MCYFLTASPPWNYEEKTAGENPCRESEKHGSEQCADTGVKQSYLMICSLFNLRRITAQVSKIEKKKKKPGRNL